MARFPPGTRHRHAARGGPHPTCGPDPTQTAARGHRRSVTGLARAARAAMIERTFEEVPHRAGRRPPRMSLDDEHEVIDSPAALFRHLSEAHGLDEARDLDPFTTPVHPWLRRHADLERAARLAAARHREDGAAPAGPAPDATASAKPERAAAPPPAAPDGEFRDPLVEALARGLARRGHDERRLRAAIRAYVSPDGRRGGEDAVRAELIGPLLDNLAAALDGGRSPGRAPAPGPSRPAPPTPPGAPPPCPGCRRCGSPCGPAATAAPRRARPARPARAPAGRGTRPARGGRPAPAPAARCAGSRPG